MAPSFGSFWSRIKDDKRPNLHSFTAPPRDTTARLLVSLYTGLFLWSSDDAKMMMMMIDHLSFHPLMMMARWQYSRNLPSPSICKRCRAKCPGSGTAVKMVDSLGRKPWKITSGKRFHPGREWGGRVLLEKTNLHWLRPALGTQTVHCIPAPDALHCILGRSTYTEWILHLVCMRHSLFFLLSDETKPNKYYLSLSATIFGLTWFQWQMWQLAKLHT